MWRPARSAAALLATAMLAAGCGPGEQGPGDGSGAPGEAALPSSASASARAPSGASPAGGARGSGASAGDTDTVVTFADTASIVAPASASFGRPVVADTTPSDDADSDGVGSSADSEASPDARASAEAGAPPDSPESGDAEVPSGGLEAWIADMRARLEEVELDPRTSYDEVLRLYTTRHGLVERYYGAGGVVTGDDHPELAEAVRQQDEAFQELLELTGTTHYIERTHLLHAIRNIRMAMERILDEAREAGVPLDPLRSGEGPDR